MISVIFLFNKLITNFMKVSRIRFYNSHSCVRWKIASSDILNNQEIVLTQLKE